MSKLIKYTSTSKFPLRFDRLHPGSLFRIHKEVSRGMRYSKDYTVYRRALDHEGFYAYDSQNTERVACLMPEDEVIPLRVSR